MRFEMAQESDILQK